MRPLIPAALTGLLAVPATSAIAGDIDLKIDIPRLDVAEYHRPYVAVWLERVDQPVTTLNVWYDTKKRDNEGTKWLKDLRTWWRRAGRETAMPMDGVSGATRAVGEQTLSFKGTASPLAKLANGQWDLVVEAARENGGREVVRVPVTWPPTSEQTLTAKGEKELGAVSVVIKP
ncbi:DUF2271 domain-containing protein [soil metagenome]